MSSFSSVLCGVVLLCSAASTVAQQFEELVGAGLPRETDATVAALFIDVEGDGDLDLVSAADALNPGAALIVRINDGAGRFATALNRTPPFLSPTSCLAAGDVDGDGDDDLIVGNRDQAQNRLYLNNGVGQFIDGTSSRLPSVLDDTRSVHLFDADGDTDLDLAIGNVLGSDRLLLNDGTGRFAVGSLPTGAADTPIEFAAGDVDGDGDRDLAIANSAGQDRLLLNDGAGGFTDASSQLPPDSRSTTAIVMVDVDGDADRDLVLGDFGAQNRIYVNDGQGVFTDMSSALLPSTADATIALAAADLDGDGDQDLVVANFSEPNCVLLNDGAGRYAVGATPTPVIGDYSHAIEIGDVDGDGDQDLFFANGRSIYTVDYDRLLINDGSAVFEDATASAWTLRDSDTTAFAVGDVDGDSFPDVVVGVLRGQNELLLNDGFGGLALATTTHLPTRIDATSDVALGDVDGDADLDLLCANEGQSCLYLNDGTGRFSDVTATHLPGDQSWSSSVAINDIDGDGDLDVVLGNAGPTPVFAQQNVLWRNDGTGRFRDDTSTALPARREFTHDVVLVDVDGDNDRDLVVANWSVNIVPNPPQTNRLLRNDGAGRFVDAQFPVDIDPSIRVAAADLDGDGDEDLVFANDDQRPTLYLGDGSGGFVDQTNRIPALRLKARSLSIADADGDGDLDVAVGNFNQTNALLVNDGAASFTDGAAMMPADREFTAAIELVDLDGDADPDLLVGNRARQIDRLYKNLARQVDTPQLARLGENYTIECFGRGASVGSRFALPWLGLRAATVPLVLPPFGVFRLDPTQTIELVPIPVGTGSGAITVQVPTNPQLAGRMLFFQAVVFDSAAPVSTARLTNVIRDRMLR